MRRTEFLGGCTPSTPRNPRNSEALVLEHPAQTDRIARERIEIDFVRTDEAIHFRADGRPRREADARACTDLAAGAIVEIVTFANRNEAAGRAPARA